MPVRAHQRRILERLLQWKRIELDHTDAAMQAQQQEITTFRTRKARLLAEVGVLGHQLNALPRPRPDVEVPAREGTLRHRCCPVGRLLTCLSADLQAQWS